MAPEPAGPAGSVVASLDGWNTTRRNDLPGSGTGVPLASCQTAAT
jgi:hypothetical protein